MIFEMVSPMTSQCLLLLRGEDGRGAGRRRGAPAVPAGWLLQQHEQQRDLAAQEVFC